MTSSDNSDNTSNQTELAIQKELFPTKSRKPDKSAAYINKVWDIRESDAAGEGALAYMAKCFIQATLPHNNPGDDNDLWVKINGNYKLEVSSKRTFSTAKQRIVNVGLPYGSIPRLLLIWMTSEAIRTKEPTLQMGNSLSQFMDKLGLNITGGKRGDITRLKNQAYRLFCSTFSMTHDKGNAWHERDLKISSERMLFWNPQCPEQGSIWESYVTLTHEFYNTLIENAAPLDMRALHALKSSSLALDVYMWLTHRTFYLSKPQYLTWEALENQMGANYKETRIFRMKARKVIQKIQVFWPDLNIDISSPEHIVLYPSRPLITPKEIRRTGSIITSK